MLRVSLFDRFHGILVSKVSQVSLFHRFPGVNGLTRPAICLERLHYYPHKASEILIGYRVQTMTQFKFQSSSA